MDFPLDRDWLHALLEAVQGLASSAARCNQRRGLVLAGSRDWGIAAARASLEAAASDRPVLWVGQDAPSGSHVLETAKAASLLGAEIGIAVYDTHSGLDPDALGAVSGAIRGGGLLLLLTPPLGAWARFSDPQHARIAVHPYRARDVSGRFLARLARTLDRAAGMLVVPEGQYPVHTPAEIPRVELRSTPTDSACLTADQQKAVEGILQVATGHPNRPLVITSDRGRGKSAALGIAAARLMQSGNRTILVTAPSSASAATLFRHARQELPGAEASTLDLRLGDSRLRFLAPDTLSGERSRGGLLLVDEAAALPAPLLERLLRRHPRVVFATTIHGYEGSGRGFAVRFRSVLDSLTPEWRGIRMETPIRWASGDPLEAWTFRALALDAAPAEDATLRALADEEPLFQCVDRDGLGRDERTLRELFGLLVLAHYRTTPMDLRHLLDGPNLSVYTATLGGHVVATALVANEGGLDEDLAKAVLAGYRRPRGHLIPQSLAAHVGLVQGAPMRCARIVRIAVHPAARRRGIGRRLVDFVRGHAEGTGQDLIGASFGATTDLLRFWERCGCLPVRVGTRRGTASGLHSLIALGGLTESGRSLFAESRRRFLQHLPHQLADPLSDLEPELCAALLRGSSERSVPPLGAQDWIEIAACAFARRGYEDSLPPVWRLAVLSLSDTKIGSTLSPRQIEVLCLRVIQRKAWSEVSAALGVPGKADALEELRGALRALFTGYAGAEIAARVRDLGLLTPAG